MQCDAFPFIFQNKRYLADRTMSGEVGAFVAQAGNARHVDDPPGTPRTRLDSLVENLQAGNVLFVAPAPAGPGAVPIPADLKGMDCVLAYLGVKHDGVWKVARYLVASGRGPDADVVVLGGDADNFKGRDLPRKIHAGDLVLFARVAP